MSFIDLSKVGEARSRVKAVDLNYEEMKELIGLLVKDL